MNDIGLYCQIVVNEIGWKSIVGIDAAHFGGGKHDGIGTILLKPELDTDLVAQIDNLTIRFEDLVAPIREIAGDGGPDHSRVTRDPNSFEACSGHPLDRSLLEE
jgi:hypothetical protein